MTQDHGTSSANSAPAPLREFFLVVAIAWGVFVTLITETLSIFNSIAFGWLLAFWCLLLLLSASFAITFLKNTRLAILLPPLPIPFWAIPLFSGLISIVILVGVTALLAPPNNWDSMTYHMSRVVHWIQDRNVSFYPTHILRQLYMNPWAEFAIMHFQILSGGDRFANLVQWFSMIGCLIGVSLLARHLGGNSRSQVFASVFAVTIPMGILQSSSTQNDYAVSLWLVSFVYFALAQAEQGPTNWTYRTGAAGLSLGLAILTKATAYMFALPFLLWISYLFVKRFGAHSWKLIVVIGAACLLINIGHYTRNFHLFRSPLGPMAEDTPATIRNDVFSPSSLISNVARNLALHLGTPSPRVNTGIDYAIRQLHTVLDIDINDPRTTWPRRTFQVRKPSLHEDTAGNALHFSLILVAIAFFLTSERLRSSPMLLGCLAAPVTGFFLICAIFKWNPWNSRYHLSLFVLVAPFVAVVLSKRWNGRLTNVIAAALLLSAFPWVLFNSSRALIGSQSVLTINRTDLYFKNRPELRDAYVGAVHFLKSKECAEIGLDIGSNDWEYPLWVLLQKDTDQKIRLEHVQVEENTSRLLSILVPFSRFSPCAIMSTRANQVEELTTAKGTYAKMWASSQISVFLAAPRL